MPAANGDWRAYYQIENPDEVEAYVAEHPSVASILREAPAEIVAALEGDPNLVLRLEFDPEDEPASNYLVVDILTALDTDAAYDGLTRFDDAWWLDAMPRAARVGATVVFMPRFT